MKPIVTRTAKGEYSTLVLPNGIIETMFFPDDGSPARTVGRTMGIATVHRQHIESDSEG